MNYLVNISILNGEKLAQSKTELLEHIVYSNFDELTSENVNHTRKEINRLFNSNNGYAVIATVNKQIVGYVVGEFIDLRKYNPIDTRHVCYITYLYVVKEHRGNGIASNMLHYLTSTNRNISGFMLMYDSEKGKLTRFYEGMGFIKDPVFPAKGKQVVMFREN